MAVGQVLVCFLAFCTLSANSFVCLVWELTEEPNNVADQQPRPSSTELTSPYLMPLDSTITNGVSPITSDVSVTTTPENSTVNEDVVDFFFKRGWPMQEIVSPPLEDELQVVTEDKQPKTETGSSADVTLPATDAYQSLVQFTPGGNLVGNSDSDLQEVSTLAASKFQEKNSSAPDMDVVSFEVENQSVTPEAIFVAQDVVTIQGNEGGSSEDHDSKMVAREMNALSLLLSGGNQSSPKGRNQRRDSIPPKSTRLIPFTSWFTLARDVNTAAFSASRGYRSNDAASNVPPYDSNLVPYSSRPYGPIQTADGANLADREADMAALELNMAQTNVGTQNNYRSNTPAAHPGQVDHETNMGSYGSNTAAHYSNAGAYGLNTRGEYAKNSKLMAYGSEVESHGYDPTPRDTLVSKEMNVIAYTSNAAAHDLNMEGYADGHDLPASERDGSRIETHASNRMARNSLVTKNFNRMPFNVAPAPFTSYSMTFDQYPDVRDDYPLIHETNLVSKDPKPMIHDNFMSTTDLLASRGWNPMNLMTWSSNMHSDGPHVSKRSTNSNPEPSVGRLTDMEHNSVNSIYRTLSPENGPTSGQQAHLSVSPLFRGDQLVAHDGLARMFHDRNHGGIGVGRHFISDRPSRNDPFSGDEPQRAEKRIHAKEETKRGNGLEDLVDNFLPDPQEHF